jgi:DNA-binding MarR family transcriptional regulator
MDAGMGLSAPKASALSVLVFGGPTSLGGLAQAEHVRAPTMSRLVAEMEAEKLVRRRTSGADARRIELVATPKARRILKHGQQRRVAYLAERIGSLASAEVQLLEDAAQLMERLLLHVEPADGEGTAARAGTAKR